MSLELTEIIELFSQGSLSGALLAISVCGLAWGIRQLIIFFKTIIYSN